MQGRVGARSSHWPPHTPHPSCRAGAAPGFVRLRNRRPSPTSWRCALTCAAHAELPLDPDLSVGRRFRAGLSLGAAIPQPAPQGTRTALPGRWPARRGPAGPRAHVRCPPGSPSRVRLWAGGALRAALGLPARPCRDAAGAFVLSVKTGPGLLIFPVRGPRRVCRHPHRRCGGACMGAGDCVTQSDGEAALWTVMSCLPNPAPLPLDRS